MLHRVKVSGDSLSPDYKEGDFVITVKIPLFLRWLQPGDVVVLRQMPYGILIKQVEWVDAILKQVFVTGTHSASIDSRTFGPVPVKNILGKVIWHIRQTEDHAA
jgi:hypothetical protein